MNSLQKWERKPVLLFVDDRPQQHGLLAAARADFIYLEKLVEMGIEPRVLLGDFARAEPYSTQLNQLGIETLDGEWYRENWENWLAENGRSIDYILFVGAYSVEKILSAIQRCSKAALIYRCDKGHTENQNSAISRCDVLLVSNAADQKLFRTRFPQKKVLVDPLCEAPDRLVSQKTISRMKKVLDASKDESLMRIAKTSGVAIKQKQARLIAFYLPQYHPIPENDEWWGDGFTEWRNVSKAEPLFSGHHQPHVPAELGYYDLRKKETRIAQADLARQYGIEGFCYYHYWFKGKRLLEHPLEELVKSGKPDFPFCICWANESWSRRWDGKDQEILMQQEYSEDDDRTHIRSLLPLFADKRYIRVNGKPMFLVYRTEKLPDPARTAEIWRNEARKAGIGELYLCRVESFIKSDPKEINFDAAVEFAPDWWNKGPQLNATSKVFDDADVNLKKVRDNNYIHTYKGLSKAMQAKENPVYKWFRCVTPSWDNWARRNEGASIFLDSSPGKYQAWLAGSVDNTNARLHGEERLVFVNAWNEWAEGNHLEPDQKFGRAYLEATSQALKDGQLATDVRRMKAMEEMKVNSLKVDRLTNQLANRNCQINELEQEMEDLLHSTSWRITKPIRWMKQRVLDLKKLFSG